MAETFQDWTDSELKAFFSQKQTLRDHNDTKVLGEAQFQKEKEREFRPLLNQGDRQFTANKESQAAQNAALLTKIEQGIVASSVSQRAQLLSSFVQKLPKNDRNIAMAEITNMLGIEGADSVRFHEYLKAATKAQKSKHKDVLGVLRESDTKLQALNDLLAQMTLLSAQAGPNQPSEQELADILADALKKVGGKEEDKGGKELAQAQGGKEEADKGGKEEDKGGEEEKEDNPKTNPILAMLVKSLGTGLSTGAPKATAQAGNFSLLGQNMTLKGSTVRTPGAPDIVITGQIANWFSSNVGQLNAITLTEQEYATVVILLQRAIQIGGKFPRKENGKLQALNVALANKGLPTVNTQTIKTWTRPAPKGAPQRGQPKQGATPKREALGKGIKIYDAAQTQAAGMPSFQGALALRIGSESNQKRFERQGEQQISNGLDRLRRGGCLSCKTHNYKVNQDNVFADTDATVDLERLQHKGNLVVKRGGAVLLKRPIANPDAMYKLLTARYNPKANYGDEAIKAFQELVKVAKPSAHRKSGKFMLLTKGKQEFKTPKAQVARLGILMGQLSAGNNATSILPEIKNILKSLKSAGAITAENAAAILSRAKSA